MKFSGLPSALPAHDACQLVYRILTDPDVEWCLVVTKHSGAVNFSSLPIASPAHDACRPEYRILTEPDVGVGRLTAALRRSRSQQTHVPKKFCSINDPFLSEGACDHRD